MSGPTWKQQACRGTLFITLVLQLPLNAVGQRAASADVATSPTNQLSTQSQILLATLERDVATARMGGDSKAEAVALNQIGQLYLSSFDGQKAFDYFSQALGPASVANDSQAQLTALRGIADAGHTLGDDDYALKAYQKALDFASAVKDTRGQIEIYDAMASTSKNQKDYTRALDFYHSELSLCQDIDLKEGQARILDAIGYTYVLIPDLSKAVESFTAALAIYKAIDDDHGEARELDSLADYSKTMTLEQRLSLRNEAAAAYHRAGDLTLEAITLNQIGQAYRESGDLSKATGFYEQSIKLNLTDNNFDGFTKFLFDLIDYGDQEASFGQSALARKAYDDVLSLTQKFQTPDYPYQLRRLCEGYAGIGDKQKSIDSCKKTLSLLKTSQDTDGEADAQLALGGVYEQFGSKQLALQAYERALQLYKVPPGSPYDREHQAWTLRSIGEIYLEQDRLQMALSTFNRAKNVYLRSLQVDHYDERDPTLDYDIGLVDEKLGKRQDALTSFALELSDASARSSYEPEGREQAQASYAIMGLFRVSDPDVAIFWGKKAIDYLQQTRLTFTTPAFLDENGVYCNQNSVTQSCKDIPRQADKALLDDWGSAYRELADLLIARGRLPEAQQVLDMMKAKELEQFTRASTPAPSNPPSYTIAEQKAEDAYQQISEKQASLAKARSQLIAKDKRSNEENERLASLEQELTAANRGFQELMARLPTILPNRQGQKVEQTTQAIRGLSNLMADLAEPKTVALYTLVTANYYRVIVIHQDGGMREGHTRIPLKVLRQKVATFQRLLSLEPSRASTYETGGVRRTPTQTAEMMEVSAYLYTTIMGPIADDPEVADAHTLVWELDDVLHYIPLASLYDPVAKRFLVEKYANAIITPADQYKLHQAPNVSQARVLAMGLRRKGFDKAIDFGELKDVPTELESIVRDPSKPDTHGVLPGSEWLDLDFTEARLIQELRQPPITDGKQQPYTIVHLASHFNADPAGSNFNSFLLLAGETKPLDQDGYGFRLTLDELHNQPRLQKIFRGVDLLTLSACQTGVTAQTENGHEIDGLGGVAEDQGASAVMASLWSVDDESTSQLMAGFYHLWTDPARKFSKADALREAQLVMLGTHSDGAAGGTLSAHLSIPVSTQTSADIAAGTFSDPYYWGPFILMGNWR